MKSLSMAFTLLTAHVLVVLMVLLSACGETIGKDEQINAVKRSYESMNWGAEEDSVYRKATEICYEGVVYVVFGPGYNFGVGSIKMSKDSKVVLCGKEPQ